MVTELADEYANAHSLYESFEKKIRSLCTDLLSVNGVLVHSVSSRTKSVASLSGKISRPDKAYESLSDITDLVGIRIITYLESAVLDVARLVEAEFYVDAGRSIDKAKARDPDTFGYSSIHYIVKLADGRNSLPEYKAFKEIFFEIQVRSILQHAWAEIEHDLGYKSDIQVPSAVRRRFSRLAGLLELADNEFDSIRSDLHSYKAEVAKQVVGLNFNSAAIPLDSESLTAYFNNSELCRRIDLQVADAFDNEIIDAKQASRFDLNRLAYFDISSVDELEKQLRSKELLIVAFAKKWSRRRNANKTGHFTSGICAFYLGYIIICERNSVDEVVLYLKSLNIGSGTRVVATAILNTYNSIKL